MERTQRLVSIALAVIALDGCRGSQQASRPQPSGSPTPSARTGYYTHGPHGHLIWHAAAAGAAGGALGGAAGASSRTGTIDRTLGRRGGGGDASGEGSSRGARGFGRSGGFGMSGAHGGGG